MGSWFQESVYYDMYYDVDEKEWIHAIDGEEYLLLTENITSESLSEDWLDDVHINRRDKLLVKPYVDYPKNTIVKIDVLDLIDLARVQTFFESVTEPKQLLGYGMLYLRYLY